MNSVEVLFRELHDVRVIYSQFLSIKVSPSRDTTGSMELITNFMQLPVFLFVFCVIYYYNTVIYQRLPKEYIFIFNTPASPIILPKEYIFFFNTPSYIQFLYSQINGYNFLHHSKNQRIKLTLL